MTRGTHGTRPRVIDLFSGCGGISWGLERSGFQVIAGVDNWGIALQTFRRNHPGAEAIEADLATAPPQDLMKRLGLRKGELEVLVGGPPCQGFSKNVPRRDRW